MICSVSHRAEEENPSYLSYFTQAHRYSNSKMYKLEFGKFLESNRC